MFNLDQLLNNFDSLNGIGKLAFTLVYSGYFMVCF